MTDPHLAEELQAGTITEEALSCSAGKWDGDEPPGDRGTLCRSILDRKLNSVGGAAGSKLPSEIIGLALNIGMPFALRFTGMFWDVHAQYHILEHLVEGFGTDSSHYTFGGK